MCRFIVCIVYIHRYTSFLTEAALTKAVSTKAAFVVRPDFRKTGSSRKPLNRGDFQICKSPRLGKEEQ